MDRSAVTQGSAEQQAIDLLLETATSHRPDARQAANFLLAWWHAHSCGGFDLQDLRQLGPRSGEQIVEILDLIWDVECGPEHLGRSQDFKDLIAKWRAHSEVGSTGTWRAPALMAVPALTLDEHGAIDRLVKEARGSGPASYAAGSLLLAWLDADQFGGFDPRLVTGLPQDVFEDVLHVVRLVARCRCHPGATGHGPAIESLAATLQHPEAPAAPHWLDRLRPAATSRLR